MAGWPAGLEGLAASVAEVTFPHVDGKHVSSRVSGTRFSSTQTNSMPCTGRCDKDLALGQQRRDFVAVRLCRMSALLVGAAGE